MVTVRQIERLWTAKRYGQLVRELMGQRPEARFGLRFDDGLTAAAAAFILIRLDELNQPFVPLYSRLTRTLLAMQESDGGWGDAPLTALCLRALLCGRGHGVAVDRGIAYLANLQKDDGLWPRVPIRRMEADPDTTAFILYQLGDQPQFRSVIRLDQAIAWFHKHEDRLDTDTRHRWQHAGLRCRARSAPQLPFPSLS